MNDWQKQKKFNIQYLRFPEISSPNPTNCQSPKYLLSTKIILSHLFSENSGHDTMPYMRFKK